MKRVFLDWNRPGVAPAVEWILRHYYRAKNPEIDLSGVLIAVTGSRAGRQLRDKLVVTAERQYRLPVRMPTITTIGTLPERLYVQTHAMAPKLVQQLAWQRAFRAVEPDQLLPVLKRPYVELPLETQLSLAEMMVRLHTELASQLLDFQAVAKRLEEPAARLLFQDMKECSAEQHRWKALAAVQIKYHELLDRLVLENGQQGLWDVQSARLYALRETSAQQDIRTEHDILLVGTVDMPRVIRQLLEHSHIRERVTPLVFAPESESERFDALGCLEPERWTPDAKPIPIDDAQISLVDTPHDQAMTVVEWMRSLPEGTTRREVSIGLPDPKLGPIVCRLCEESGEMVRYTPGRSAAETPLYRLLAAMADYLEHGTFADLATLARHPDLSKRLQQMVASDSNDACGEASNILLPRLADDWLESLDRFQSRRPTFHLPSESIMTELASMEPITSTESVVVTEMDGHNTDEKNFRQIQSVIRGLLAPLLAHEKRVEQTRHAEPVKPVEPVHSGGQSEVGPTVLSFLSLAASTRLERELSANDARWAQLRNRRPLRDWAISIRQTLRHIYAGRPLQTTRGLQAAVAEASFTSVDSENPPKEDEPKTYERKSAHLFRDAVRAMDAVLEGWQTLPMSLQPLTTSAEAIRLLLRQMAKARAYDEEPRRDAVEILGWLELATDDAPHLILCGMNEQNVPAARNGDLFLPNALREYLHIESNDRSYARDAYVLCRLLASRQSLHLVAGRHTATDDPLIPSRLLFATSLEEIARRAKRLFGDAATTPTRPVFAEKCEPEPSPTPRTVKQTTVISHPVEQNVAERNTVEPTNAVKPITVNRVELTEREGGLYRILSTNISNVPNISSDAKPLESLEPHMESSTVTAQSPVSHGHPSAFHVPEPVAVPLPQSHGLPVVSVTELRDYLACPYRYYLRHRLKLRPLDDTIDELDALLFGSLVHELLGDFAQHPEICESQDAQEIETFLSERLDQLAALHFGVVRHSSEKSSLVSSSLTQALPSTDPLPAIRVQIEQLRYRLRGFAAWQANWTRQGWHIAYAEAPENSQKGRQVNLANQQEIDFRLADGRRVRLRGRIDRIDWNDQGAQPRLVIFDYKTSEKGEPPEKTHGHPAAKTPKVTFDTASDVTKTKRTLKKKSTTEPSEMVDNESIRKPEWTDLQLPLYRYLASQIPLRGPVGGQPRCFPAEQFEVGYILLPKQPDAVGAAIAQWNEDDFAGAEHTAQERIAELIDGRYPFDPNLPAKIRSRYPEFSAICMENSLSAPDVEDEEEDT